jgi:non-heme chloroperoxidase
MHGDYVTTDDGVGILYKDWGSGQPIVFSHGWPLSADDWDTQMTFFLNRGYRVADDLAALTAHLDLKNAIHVGHSTGGGEVVHYMARHGESRVAAAGISARHADDERASDKRRSPRVRHFAQNGGMSFQ